MSSDSPSNARNKAVYDALREYFQTLLHPNVIDRVPLQRKRKFRDEDYAKRTYYDTIIPNRQAVRRLFVRFDSVDGYDKAADALKSCPFYDIDRRIENAALSYTFDEFFRAMIDRSPIIGEFDQNTFDDVYQDFEQFHTADRVPMRAWTYLFGFDMPVDEIEVDPRFTIREMNANERESLYEKLQDNANKWRIRRDDVYQNYVIEYCFKQPNTDVFSPRRDHAMSQLDRLLTAIRIFRPDGTVNTGHVFIEPTWDYTEGNIGMNVIKRRKYGGMEYCEFTPGDCDRFPDFFHTVESHIKTESDGTFKSPLTRLNESHEKYSHEDRILSCAIGFENLIMSGERSGSYSFRLQLRPSVLLKQIVHESTNEVRDFFKSMYWSRGEIVHNDRDLDEIMDDNEFKLESEGYSTSEYVNDVQYFLGTIIRTYMLFDAVADIPVQRLNQEIEDAAFSAELDVSYDY